MPTESLYQTKMAIQDYTNVRIAIKLPGQSYWLEAELTGKKVPLVEPPAVGDNAPRVRGMEDMTLGVIVPLYVHPNSADWMHFAIISNNYRDRGLHLVAIVDVSGGPGVGVDNNLRNGIRLLKANGATVISYVNTMMGQQNEIMTAMSNWKTWYPEIDGFFFDKMTLTAADSAFFRVLDSYAKYDLGCSFTVGGPVGPNGEGYGFDGESYLADTDIDVILSYRGKGIPVPASQIKKPWMSNHPRSRFGIIATGVDSAAVTDLGNFIMEAVGNEHAFGYVYVHTDAGDHRATEVPPGPFSFLSALLEPTVRTLVGISEGEMRDLPERTRRVIANQRSLIAHSQLQQTDPNSLVESPLLHGGPHSIPAPEDRDVRVDSPQDYDQWGIKKIHQDNMATNRAQSFYFDSGTWDNEARLIKYGNVIKTRDGDFILEDGRLWITSLPDRKWLNTEQTAFFYYEGDVDGAKFSGTPEKYAVQFSARGGEHLKERPCESACYKSRLYTDGKVTAVKEIAEQIVGVDMGENAATGGVSVQGRWIGLKQVMYNWQEEDEGPVYVVIETYLDDNCTDSQGRLAITNRWRMVSRVIDRGGWTLRDTKQRKDFDDICKEYAVSVDTKKNMKRKVTDIISRPGGSGLGGQGPNNCAIRAQGSRVRFKFWSVREIIAPINP